jgi:hypothetical protein
MQNEWRVDRARDACPVGMLSLRYLGTSERLARRAYDETLPGFTPWDTFDPRYGVALSRWDAERGFYVRMAFKTSTAHLTFHNR